MINKYYVLRFYASLVVIILLAFSCICEKKDVNRQLRIHNKMVSDSIENCKYARSEAYEQIKRGNLILYRNFGDYLHAQEFLLNKYDIVLLPEIIAKSCAQEVMDSIISRKYGENFISIIEKEISMRYNNTPKNCYLGGVHSYVEHLPEYRGGIDSLYCYIYGSLESYKVCDVNYIFEHELVVNFVIDSDGSIINPKIVIKLCPEIDKMTLEVIKNMKKWTPALNEDNPVPYLMTLIIDWNEKDIRICK